MGCFSTCLPKSSRQRRRYSPRSIASKARPTFLNQKLEVVGAYQVAEPSVQFLCGKVIVRPLALPDQETTHPPPHPHSQDEEEKGKLMNISGRKKVTFDLNVKIYEELPAERVSDEMEKGDETIVAEKDVDIDDVNNDVDDDVDNDVSVDVGDDVEDDADGMTSNNQDSSSSSVFTYPPNYRYQDCRDSDDEYHADGSDIDEDLHDDDDQAESEIKHNLYWAEEESSESLFSLSAESRRRNHPTVEMRDMEEEVSSHMPVIKDLHSVESEGIELNSNNEGDHESRSVESVLDPVENLAHWKKARTNEASSGYQVKENLKHYMDSNILSNEEPNVKTSKRNLARSKGWVQDIAVDTSLSSWLLQPKAVTSETKSGSSVSVGNRSPSQRTRSFEDRPILGALTVEEIKQFSASSSPRRSPGRSPDDMPIIGTVGSYWSDKATDSDPGAFTTRSTSITRKRIEDKKVTWNPLPFETRLEIALQNGSPEA